MCKETMDLEKCSKEELIARIRVLQSHNLQLQNIIAKSGKTSSKSSRRKQKPFDFSKCKYRHVLLKFYYLGWNYHGYVVQEDTSNTIEHEIFTALVKTCLIQDRASSNYHRCGRTDKGVSSFSQTISIDLRSISDNPDQELNYCKILNRVLPENIQIIAWCPADSDLSARFDCKSRTYKYFFPKAHLDIDTMKTASKHLIGSHDFRNFCKMDVGNGVIEFIRNLVSIDIEVLEENANEFSFCVVTIVGNAFLWHQIRCIMGILFLIGQKKESPEIVLELLDVDRNSRKPDYNMASEIPLNLYQCDYDSDLKWVYEQEALDIAITKLRNSWTFSAIKTSMMQMMLVDLQRNSSEPVEETCNECLVQGVKPRNYTPVMKRQLCESLEKKIQHHKKKKQIK